MRRHAARSVGKALPGGPGGVDIGGRITVVAPPTQTTSSGSPVSVSIPTSIRVGDLILIFAVSLASTTNIFMSETSGFNRLSFATAPYSGQTNCVAHFGKIATASDAGRTVEVSGAGAVFAVNPIVLRGVVSALANAAAVPASASPAIPNVFLETATRKSVLLMAMNGNGPDTTSLVFPSGYEVIGDFVINGGGRGFRFGLARNIGDTSGTVGVTRGSTLNTSLAASTLVGIGRS